MAPMWFYSFFEKDKVLSTTIATFKSVFTIMDVTVFDNVLTTFWAGRHICLLNPNNFNVCYFHAGHDHLAETAFNRPDTAMNSEMNSNAACIMLLRTLEAIALGETLKERVMFTAPSGTKETLKAWAEAERRIIIDFSPASRPKILKPNLVQVALPFQVLAGTRIALVGAVKNALHAWICWQNCHILCAYFVFLCFPVSITMPIWYAPHPAYSLLLMLPPLRDSHAVAGVSPYTRTIPRVDDSPYSLGYYCTTQLCQYNSITS